MIIDCLRHAEKYENNHEGFREAFDFLRNANDKPDGSYELIPGKVKVNISTYENKLHQDCRYESHERMIDIQCVLEGTEQIDLYDSAAMTICEDKYKSDDIAFLDYEGVHTAAQLKAGDFVVIYPLEAHRPCMAVNNVPVKVRKAVVKILY